MLYSWTFGDPVALSGVLTLRSHKPKWLWILACSSFSTIFPRIKQEGSTRELGWLERTPDWEKLFDNQILDKLCLHAIIFSQNRAGEDRMRAIKTVGAGGQISLGKEYAGRNVLIEKIEPGVWIIKVGEFIPESERWLHRPGIKVDLDEAIAWAEKNPPKQSNLEGLERALDE
jgi:hypothetical protein